jgi:ubiquinone/menaquinone biosynthesis C-methylase UbiE
MSSPAEAFLVDFHNRMPSGSSAAFGALPVHSADGQPFDSSYHAIAARLAAIQATLPPGPLLDLACGDGHLLGLLAPLVGQTRPLWGLDFSAGELAAARARLGDAVRLQQARAQALPLDDASVAVVSCHMALMLMAEPEQVVAELGRVLQPGGRLLAVVPAAPPRGTAPPPLLAAWLAAMDGVARQTNWQSVQFDGRRWRTPDTITDLLQPAFAQISCTPLQALQHLSPDAAWAWFIGMYDLHLLPPAAWPAVEARFRGRLPALCDADGLVALPQRYLLIDATAAS